VDKEKASIFLSDLRSIGFMDQSTKNFLYDNPEFYELAYPEPDEATPNMCLRMFEKYLPSLPTSILDIGCGTGRDLEVLSRTCVDCWGVDYLPKVIDYAKSIRPGLHLQAGDMRSIRLGRVFDVIMCMGSAFMYALTNEDIEKTLQTFAEHAHSNSLLILDLNNAASFLGGKNFKERIETKIDKPEFRATAISEISLDRRNQTFIRKRTWDIPGKALVQDYCQYRLFFPKELEMLLKTVGFKLDGMFDNKELKETDFSGPRIYAAFLKL
jgi:SAM-dependent methyltransferase